MSHLPHLSRPSSIPAPSHSHSSASHPPPTSHPSAPLSSSAAPPNLHATLSPNPLPQGTYNLPRLLEKQHEWQAVALLKSASAGMLEQVEALAQEGEIMRDGGRAVGSVLANWPNVFRIISLCSSGQPVALPNGADASNPEEEQEEIKPLPRLVRLQVDGLQSTESGRTEGA